MEDGGHVSGAEKFCKKMTSKEVIKSESENIGTIILYREGMFWKAYEHSAWFVCTFVRPLKVSKKRVKLLDGAEMVSVGFPDMSLETMMKGHTLVSSSGEELYYASVNDFNRTLFDEWKASLPAKGRQASPEREKSADEILERIRKFKVASSTPIECMMFVTELQSML